MAVVCVKRLGMLNDTNGFVDSANQADVGLHDRARAPRRAIVNRDIPLKFSPAAIGIRDRSRIAAVAFDIGKGQRLLVKANSKRRKRLGDLECFGGRIGCVSTP